MSKGWVKIWREDIENNPYWPGNKKQPFTKMEAWLDLSILLAQGVDTETLKKGQAEVSVRFLSKRWQWSIRKIQIWLRQYQKWGYLKQETSARSRKEMSIFSVFRKDTVSDTVSDTVKPLDQKSLFRAKDTVSDTVENTVPRVNARVMGRSKREANSKPVGENAKREAANRIREHCLEHGHWKPFRSGKTKEQATRRIMAWLGKDGYTEQELIGYVDTYIRKRKTHLDYIEEYGEKPFYEDLRWCPHTKWPISELFRKSAKYPDQWIGEAEKPVTQEDRVKAADEAVKDLYKRGDPGGI